MVELTPQQPVQEKKDVLSVIPLDASSLIFSHLDLTTLLKTLHCLDRKWYGLSNMPFFWRRILLDWRLQADEPWFERKIREQVTTAAERREPYSDLIIFKNSNVAACLLDQENIKDIMVGLAVQFLREGARAFNPKVLHPKLSAIEASSQDFNQSIHMTLTRNNTESFWSSGPSDSSNDSDFLVYKLADSKAEAMLFSSVTLATFDPTTIQQAEKDYPPNQI